MLSILQSLSEIKLISLVGEGGWPPADRERPPYNWTVNSEQWKSTQRSKLETSTVILNIFIHYYYIFVLCSSFLQILIIKKETYKYIR